MNDAQFTKLDHMFIYQRERERERETYSAYSATVLFPLILVAQSYPTLCDPMDCSAPGFPVHHRLPEPTQTHVHSIGDSI